MLQTKSKQEKIDHIWFPKFFRIPTVDREKYDKLYIYRPLKEGLRHYSLLLAHPKDTPSENLVGICSKLYNPVTDRTRGRDYFDWDNSEKADYLSFTDNLTPKCTGDGILFDIDEKKVTFVDQHFKPISDDLSDIDIAYLTRHNESVCNEKHICDSYFSKYITFDFKSNDPSIIAIVYLQGNYGYLVYRKNQKSREYVLEFKSNNLINNLLDIDLGIFSAYQRIKDIYDKDMFDGCHDVANTPYFPTNSHPFFRISVNYFDEIDKQQQDKSLVKFDTLIHLEDIDHDGSPCDVYYTHFYEIMKKVFSNDIINSNLLSILDKYSTQNMRRKFVQTVFSAIRRATYKSLTHKETTYLNNIEWINVINHLYKINQMPNPFFEVIKDYQIYNIEEIPDQYKIPYAHIVNLVLSESKTESIFDSGLVKLLNSVLESHKNIFTKNGTEILVEIAKYYDFFESLIDIGTILLEDVDSLVEEIINLIDNLLPKKECICN